jgi:hypothetical protein
MTRAVDDDGLILINRVRIPVNRTFFLSCAPTAGLRLSKSLHPARIVRRFARDSDVVDVALAQTGTGDAHEHSLLME